MAVVLDASVILKWFVEDEMSRHADGLLDRVCEEGALVPALFRWEAQSVLVRAMLDARLDLELMEKAFDVLSALPISVEDAGRRLMLGGEAALALQYNLTPYDAAYLAVALDHELELATADNDLARAARDAEVAVFHLR
ncbi:MAG: type II toxin-antitoxin system VapC family toxin [Candidatus Eremiobacteraeota bacterium]|nr:type II toxin-antitoxin system VapC family toxin [Candidatus Eremiobacteraeota bacterium]